MIKLKRKVIIVGAGPGGLAAAILLQRSGVDVTVVERREAVGGRTSTIERNGFKFDAGPTFFLYPRVLREILAAAGRDLDQEIPMYRLNPQYRLVFGAGGELLATPDLERAIAELNPEDARGFHRFFCDNRNKLEKFLPFLESPFESWRDLAKLDMIKMLPLLLEMTTLKTIVAQRSRDRRAYQPTTPAHEPFFAGYIQAVHGGNWLARWHGLHRFLRTAARLD
jgi:phytoene desaturase